MAKMPELTPLHHAALCGKANIIELLLKNGADVNAHNISGTTPLKLAVEGDYYDAARLLLENGADVNMPASLMGGAEQTPLDIAYKVKNDLIIGLLEKHGGKRGA